MPAVALLALTPRDAATYPAGMRISFSTGTIYHRGLDYTIRLAADAGFDGVELVLGPQFVLRGVHALRKIARTAPIPILSVHPPFYPMPGWPRGVTRAIPRLAEVTRDLGIPLCVVHTVDFADRRLPRGLRYADAIERARAAAGPDVTLALESNQYNNRGKKYVLDDLATLVRYATERGCGVTFDTSHAGANRENLLDDYAIVKPALRNVHLSDVVWIATEPRTHVLPGAGELHLERFLAALAGDGYDGPVTMEIHPLSVGLYGRTRQLEHMRKAVEFVRAATAPTQAPESPAASAQS